MIDNAITVPIPVFLFAIATSLVAVGILIGVLKIQLRQFQIKSDLQRMKVFLTVMIGSLLLANLVTLGLSLALFNKPIPAEAVSIGSSINRFNALVTTIALGLVYKFQIGDGQD